MTIRRTDELIERLGNDAAPVKPLRPPMWRALTMLGAMAMLGVVAIALLAGSWLEFVHARVGSDPLFALELLAMLGTGAIAVTGAFHLSVPGRSKWWLGGALAPLLAWLMLSGLGCYRELIRNGPAGWEGGHSLQCLLFIVGASILLGLPLIWRLSRSSPVEPLPVALLGGLGIAALAAFLLQFFHPFAVTFIDLAFHIVAVVIVVGVCALLKRPLLQPA